MWIRWWEIPLDPLRPKIIRRIPLILNMMSLSQPISARRINRAAVVTYTYPSTSARNLSHHTHVCAP